MQDIKADVWFANIVWQTKLNIDNSILLNKAKELELYTSSVNLTNQGGYQSKSLGTDVGEVKEIVTILDQIIAKCCDSVQLPKLNFFNLWFNINKTGNYNSLHNHHGSILSGVYYIDVPAPNMGNIEFHRADDYEYYMPPLKKYNQFTSQKATYKPETGMLLIFPSWLKHQVTTNQSDKERVSLSFNYGV
jgi:uncharacterized protein (TIGR02466 family)